MPRIPLYNQGQGSATRLATGQLSRRADTGAFAALGQASASFARSAGKVVTDFALAERNRKDKILLEDVQNKAIEYAKIKAKEDEGIVDGSFQGDIKATARNELIYRKHKQKGEIDVDKDEYGLHQMKYEIESIQDDIYNRHKLINVRF